MQANVCLETFVFGYPDLFACSFGCVVCALRFVFQTCVNVQISKDVDNNSASSDDECPTIGEAKFYCIFPRYWGYFQHKPLVSYFML